MIVEAILIIGHSNSGKSPLGEKIQELASNHKRKYHHLDFGDHLRKINNRKLDIGFDEKDLEYLSSVMRGQLLDDEHFYIARLILEWFLAANNFDPSIDILVLNGMPRHIGQAKSLDQMGVEVTKVIWLDCPIETAYKRKMLAEKGVGHEDRSARGDSAPEVFWRKLGSFEGETSLLLDYYRMVGRKIVTVRVTIDQDPDSAYNKIRDFIILK